MLEPKNIHKPCRNAKLAEFIGIMMGDGGISKYQIIITFHHIDDLEYTIPEWIKRDREFAIACLRGLVDTDGCVFTHRYRVKCTSYAYKKLSFTSASEPLQHSVHAILQKFGFHSRISGHDVRLDSVEDMKRYFLIVGSHNPKHLRRYKNAVV